MIQVKNRTLLIIAGIVWLIAGINVTRMGLLAYKEGFVLWEGALSLLTFLAFGAMFYKMSQKHTKRILSNKNKKQPFYHFFDGKSYAIMAVMMSGGILLRAKHLVPTYFIAFFYTGLGLALSLAGLTFLRQYQKSTPIEAKLL